jgi:hypothetical protein
MVQQYLGLRHCYGELDCIILAQKFYKEFLGLDFSIPEYPKSSKWMKTYTVEYIDSWIEQYGKKVKLTEAKNYDLISFKSDDNKFFIHFGIFLAPNKLLHIEEKSVSKIEMLDDYWRSKIHAMYRHNDMV